MYFEQQFLVFKQYYTYFYTFFTHIFFKNTNNIIVTITKQAFIIYLCYFVFVFVFCLLVFFHKQGKKYYIVIDKEGFSFEKILMPHKVA